MVMFGTKWPSMTSTWIQSAPAASIARISSPSLEKSDARIDGAIKSGRIKASRRGSSNTRRCGEQRAALTSPQPPRQRLEHERKKVNRKLREAEIEPGELGQREAGGGQHDSDIAVGGENADREGALTARCEKQQCGRQHRAERKAEGEK